MCRDTSPAQTRRCISIQLPTTSQPSPGKFIELYEKLFAAGFDIIISLHISSNLSGTYQAAIQAAEQIRRGIRVIDSRSISLGTAVQVMAASEAIAAGKDVEDVIRAIDASRTNHEVMFTLNTLEYLAKGGRIGKAKRVCVAVGAADEAGQHLKLGLHKAFGVEPSVSQVGPVVGVHTGPGTVGAANEFIP